MILHILTLITDQIALFLILKLILVFAVIQIILLRVILLRVILLRVILSSWLLVLFLSVIDYLIGLVEVDGVLYAQLLARDEGDLFSLVYLLGLDTVFCHVAYLTFETRLKIHHYYSYFYYYYYREYYHIDFRNLYKSF